MHKELLKIAAMLALSAALTHCASAANKVWTGNGNLSNPFGDSANWQNGLPVKGDAVHFDSAAKPLTIGDDDAAFVSRLDCIYLMNNCKVFWNVSTNSYFTTKLQGGMNGMFYKMGTSSLTFVIPYSNQWDVNGAYTVVAGKLYLNRYSDPNYSGTFPKASLYVTGYAVVSNGATLVLAEKSPTTQTTSNFYYLENYGLVTNENANVRHIFSFRTDSSYSTPERPSFSYGPIGGNVEYNGYGCCNFYCTNNTFVTYNPMSSGSQSFICTTGLMKFGTKDDPISSMGMAAGLGYTWSGVLARYLGTGETTDKPFSYKLHPDYYKWNHNYLPGIDGGPYGGLIYKGTFTLGVSTNVAIHTGIQFSGTNASPCELWSNFSNYVSKNGTNCATFVCKRGSGTWFFRDGNGLIFVNGKSRVNPFGGLTGCFLIEEGVVQTESMSDTGDHSALGGMCDLYGDYYGVHHEAKRVDWAISFGTEDENGVPLTEGTLESLSTNLAFASGRKMVLRGNGRLKSSGIGAFRMCHVRALTAGEKTFTLDGSNTLSNVIQEITDGDGKVNVAKEGSGKWILRGNQTFSGDLTVREGVLEVEAPTNTYTWFRFSDRANQASIGQLTEIALYDADGKQQNVGLKYPAGTTVDGNKRWVRNEWTEIGPGCCFAGRACDFQFYTGGNSIVGIFDGTAQNGAYYCNTGTPALDSFLSRNSLVMHLTNGVPPIVSYDVCQGNNDTYKRITSAFRLDGSRDGCNWVTLHEWTSATASTNDISKWCSNGDAFVKGEKRKPSDGKGFALTDWGQEGVSSLVNVRSVRVDRGATLRTSYKNVAPIRKLCVDKTGGGVIDGFELAQDGEIEIIADGGLEPGHIPFSIVNSETASNISDWTISVVGAGTSRYKLVANPEGVDVYKMGLTVIIR